jgi:hypothetical protein
LVGYKDIPHFTTKQNNLQFFNKIIANRPPPNLNPNHSTKKFSSSAHLSGTPPGGFELGRVWAFVYLDWVGLAFTFGFRRALCVCCVCGGGWGFCCGVSNFAPVGLFIV